MTWNYLKLGFCLLISLILFGCNSSNSAHSGNTEKIEIAPLLSSLPLDINVQLSTTAFQNDGSKLDITQSTQWTSSNESISSVDSKGMLTTHSSGTHQVFATYKEFSTQIDITVKNDALQSLNINPTNLSIAKHTKTQLNVMGIFESGSTLEVSDQVIWGISDETVLTLNDKRFVYGVNTGKALLTASLNSISSSMTIHVIPGTLTSILIEYDKENIRIGDTIPLRAIGLYAEGYRQDLTKQVSWGISDTSLLNIDPDTLTATALANGNITVTAKFNEIEAYKTFPVEKESVDLQSIEIGADDTPLSVGKKRQFNVYGRYSDGSKVNLTQSAIWSSDSLSLIISNNIGYEGNALALQAGSATLTASVKHLTTTSNITISPAELISVDLVILHPSIPLATSTILTVIGTYSDGSTKDVSQFATWQSSEASLLHVSNEANKQGTIKALATGTSRITASFDGQQDSENIAVNQAKLISISIEGSETPVQPGQSSSYRAIGIYSNGQKLDITHLTTWQSSAPEIIPISNGTENPGSFSVLSAGTVKISASYENISNSVNVSTLTSTIENIVIYGSQTAIPVGNTGQLTASAIYSDNTVVNITPLGQWKSLNEQVLSVSNAENKQGQLNVLAAGSGFIQISYFNVTAEIKITTSNAALIAIEISPQNIQMIKDTQLNLIATGVYSDKSTQDITQQVSWSSNRSDIASIENVQGKNGNLRAITSGEAIITASMNNLSADLGITVNNDVIEGISIHYDGQSTLAIGTYKQLSAIGNYSSGASQDLSQQVTWQSADSNICSISTDDNNSGKLLAHTAGQCTISASFSGANTAISFAILDTSLISISLSPPELIFAKGTRFQLQATGHYSDENTQDLSTQVTWSTSSTNISVNPQGLLKALTEGTATIQAHLSGIQQSIEVTVSSATLESITIIPSSLSIAKNLNQQLQATGLYSDDSSQNITQSVLWESSNEQVITVSNGINTVGLASALTAGEATITAIKNNVSSTINASVELIPTAPKSISLTATPYIILKNETDSSSISIKIATVDSAASVADGTKINLNVLRGTATLSSSSVLSNNGEASFSLQSNVKGIITVKATIDGTNISNIVSIYSTDNFAEIIARGIMLSAKTINNVVQTGAKFGLLIVNYANRPFNLIAFSIRTKNEIIYSTTSPEQLSNNILERGEYIFSGWETKQERENSFFAFYELNEPDTNTTFSIGVIYVLPENN